LRLNPTSAGASAPPDHQGRAVRVARPLDLGRHVMKSDAALGAALVDRNLAASHRVPVIGSREDGAGAEAEMVMRRIVVIDDEPLILRATQRLLQALGHRARTYVDGRVALELMRWERADVVLVDLHMSNMDGIQVLCRLLTLNHAPALIVMSGDGGTPVKARLAELGLAERVGYLGKPFTVIELEEALARALRGRPSH
jgi:CheY-like chemotaxis protein